MKKWLSAVVFVLVCALSVWLFPRVAAEPLTFIDLSMDPEKTTAKYADVWDDHTILQMSNPNTVYQTGDVIGTITIPKLNIYELNIYYESNYITSNWQISAPGHTGNWGIPGESTPTCIGSHNYQLFNKLPSLEVGDSFIIETDWDIYVYIVTETQVYNHLTDDWSETTYSSKKPYCVELMTCYPISEVTTKDMYIVTAQMTKGTQFTDN